MIFDGFRELMDASVALVLLLDLVFFSYLAFRLTRERELFGPARDGLLPAPKPVRADRPEWRRDMQ